MFILEADATEFLAKIIDIKQISFLVEAEIHGLLKMIFEENHLTSNDIDALILGFNSDTRIEFWYANLTRKIFPNHTIFAFKDLIGENPSSSAFATFLGTKILSGQKISVRSWNTENKKIERILIYNSYMGVQHGFILMSS
jgi:hypothetical protein